MNPLPSHSSSHDDQTAWQAYCPYTSSQLDANVADMARQVKRYTTISRCASPKPGLIENPHASEPPVSHGFTYYF